MRADLDPSKSDDTTQMIFPGNMNLDTLGMNFETFGGTDFFTFLANTALIPRGRKVCLV